MPATLAREAPKHLPVGSARPGISLGPANIHHYAHDRIGHFVVAEACGRASSWAKLVTMPFEDSIAAFDRAVEGRETDVKIQIEMSPA